MMPAFHHVSLAVTNIVPSVEFLGRWLGFKVTKTLIQNDGSPIAHLSHDDHQGTIELITRRTIQFSRDVHIGIYCSDSGLVAEEIRLHSGASVMGPQHIGNEVIYFVELPPDGWLLELNNGLI